MPDLYKFMRAIRRSSLSAPERHTLLTLASLIEPETGLIPERFQPSLTDLVRFTGLSRSTVIRSLNVAEDANWIKRTVPTKKAARENKEKTSYLLLIPNDALSEAGDDPSRASVTGTLVSQGHQPGPTAQGGPSATVALGLVPQGHGASVTVAHEVLSHVNQDEPPPPAEGGVRDEADDPGALFSVPGQRNTAAGETKARTAPKEPARPKRQRMSREITKTAEALPADWFVSDEMKAWAKAKAKDVIERLATEKFLVYFGDGRKKKSDWDKTWRNWMLTDQQRFEERVRSPAQNGSGYVSGGTGASDQQRSRYHQLRDSRAPGRNYKEKL